MATKPAGEPLAIVDGRWMLPLTDAVALLHLLCRATPVTREYVSNVGYVPKLAATAQDYSFTPVTLTQLAAMNLED